MAKHAAQTETAPSKPVRRYKKRMTAAIALLAVLGVVCLTVGVVLWQMFDYDYDSEIKKLTNEQLGITNTTLTKKVTNIALFGVDSRNSSVYSGNTDSIMIVSIDQIHNKIKITSVMRDTLVNIPGKGYAKINSAYAKGGPELALKTLNTMFDLNIRHYATVNFSGMVDIVDAIGGVEVEITEVERRAANDLILATDTHIGTTKDLINKAGKRTLTGVQAVCWSRIRSVSTADGVSNDFGRTDRQRVVMEAMFNRMMSMGASQYPSLIQALLPYVRTSLAYADILPLVGVVMGDTTFEQTRIPLSDYVINADYRDITHSSTVYYNLEYAAEILHAFIYDDVSPETYIAENGVDKTPWAG